MHVGSDYHIHTKYLKCADETMTISNILESCGKLGRTSIGITDHLNNRESLPSHFEIKKDIEKSTTSIEVFFGVEVGLLNEKGEIPYNEKIRDMAGFKFAIGGAHEIYIKNYDIDELIKSRHEDYCRLAANPLIDVIAHPWWFRKRDFGKKEFPLFDDMAVIPKNFTLEFASIARANKTAVEINPRAIFCNPDYSNKFKWQYKKYLKQLNEEGVMFSIGSDAHTINDLQGIKIAEEICDEIGISKQNIWNPYLGKTWRWQHDL